MTKPKRKIKWQFAFSILAIVAVLILVCFLSFKGIFETVAELSVKNATVSVTNVSTSIQNLISNVDRLVSSLCYSDEVRFLLKGDESFSAKVQKKIDEISFPEGVNEADIYLINNSTKVVASTRDTMHGMYKILGSQWIHKVHNADGKLVLISGYSVRKADKGKVISVFCLSRSIKDTDGTILGMLMVELPISLIVPICQSAPIENGGFFVILDNDNYVIYHTREEEIGSQQILIPSEEEKKQSYFTREINGIHMLVTSGDVYNDGFLVMGFVPFKNTQTELLILRERFIASIVLIGFVSVLFSWFVATGITNPIVELIDHMHVLEEGNFSVRINSNRKNEIGMLENGFDNMAQKLESLVDTVYKYEIQEKEARIEALKATVNPHFIYNALESISMTAYLNDDSKVVEMTNILADILRSSLNMSDELITVSKEIENVKNYFYLTLISHPGLFEYSIDIEDGLENYRLLPHLIQPLVENAIVHGFEDIDSDGFIEINVFKADDRVVCSVRNNGKPFDVETLEKLQNSMACGIAPEHYSAIFNENERIRLTYGSEYGILINSSSKFVEMLIQLPLFYHEPAGDLK